MVKMEKVDDLDDSIPSGRGTRQGDASANPISITPSPISFTNSSPIQPPSFSSSPVPPASPSPSSRGLQSNTANLVWPGGIYTTDIVYVFRLMDDLKKSSHTSHLCLEDRFDAAFPGVPYKSTTYANARTRYGLVDQQKLEDSLNAGSTRRGLWTTLARSVKLRR